MLMLFPMVFDSDTEYGNVDMINQRLARQPQLLQEYPMHFV